MTKINDLGQLNGDVMLFGGPYSNLQATNAAMDWADHAGIAAQNRLCSGDMVAYCADANAVVETVRRRGGPVIAGNCEKQLAEGADDCGCGFEAGTQCSVLAKDWYAYANRQVSATTRSYMADLPDWIVFTHLGRRYCMIHGGAQDISRFLWPTSDDSDFRQEINVLQGEVGAIDAVISGHSGLSFDRRIGDVDWINAGVIGMPANNGDAATCFAQLTDQGVQFHPLRYDHTSAAAAMRAVGLTQGYEAALVTGFWPSQDVLPQNLRRSVPSQRVVG